LLFSDKPWAGTLARMLGGFELAGLIHRICAFFMLGMFACHLVTIVRRAIVTRNVLRILWGPDSMVPQPQDAVDVYKHVKWFLGLGPQPTFDRWTYWEKFDYWAVFWGMAIIGGSGLLLWFPVFFAKFLPGWMFNIAALIHGEEALLAVAFIFTIHFYNGHIRPERFPMDTVIFTGRISEHELQRERGVEYERLRREGRLAAYEAPPPTLESRVWGWFVGGAALLLGIVAIVLIVYSLVS
jgi:thiosulfate reductase cytochrome b subunit